MRHRMQPLESSLYIAQVRQKIAQLEMSCDFAFRGAINQVPDVPGRDVEVMAIRDLPPKPGLSKAIGQARMLHDLANIELQAMELGLRTLIEFPQAPSAFRQRLAEITIEEGEHLRLSLNAIEELGFQWGQWPVHLGLWRCVGPQDTLLDRVLMVHRFMEGSGLDAGETIRRRLSGTKGSLAMEVADRIARDELSHVQFGSEWYRELCRLENLNPQDDFAVRLQNLFHRLPRRLEPLAVEVRRLAGFSQDEIEWLEKLRQRWLTATERIHPVRPDSRFGT
ncbi:MAG: DUF455 family protein [Bdellovibrionales bacterium]